MASQQSDMILDQIPVPCEHVFLTPEKRINDGDDLQFFHTTKGYRDILTWLAMLNRSMFPIKDSDGNISRIGLDKHPQYSQHIQSLRSLLAKLNNFVEQAPPDTGPRRFGNIAFRTWFELLEDNIDALLDSHLAMLLERYDQPQRTALRDEVKVYLLGGFGSAQRLDYGTGHELSFLAFLGCLWKLKVFDDSDNERRAIVVGILQAYLELIRRLVLLYTLEPAGSHGVWGLDDHSFLPYIFGSAQFGPAINPSLRPPQPTPTEGALPRSPNTNAVIDKERVAMYKESNMYFSAIQFVYDVKKGPFWEHSPVLYDISGVKGGWGKVNKGLVKMWVAEVVGKFPVVQHFPFGSLFRWERDPEAGLVEGSVHAKELPKGGESVAALPMGAGGAGTKAPWANSAAGRTAAPVAGGIPSTRAPWAAAASVRQQQAPPNSGAISTAAPWASAPRPGAPGGTSGTVAMTTPWNTSRTSRSDDRQR